MSRLTEREINLIQSARAARRHEPAGAEHFIAKARALQSDAAAELAGRFLTATGIAGLGAWVYDTTICPIADALQRRRTIQQLRRLDDHLLQDIGLERGMVETFGETLSARQVAPGRSSVSPLARCRNWLQRRDTIKELNALSDRQLADIGVLRGRIDEVVAEAQKQPAPSLRGAPRRSRLRRAVSAASVEAMTYVTLKVDPPLRPRAARMAEAANQGGSRVLPLWLGPWLPASQRNVA